MCNQSDFTSVINASEMMILATFFVFLMINFVTSATAEAPKSGPYVVVPISQQECLEPSKPFEKVRSLVVKAELVNTTSGIYSRGSFHVFVSRKFTNVMIRGRVYQREGDKWQIIKAMNSNGCRGYVITLIMRAMGIKYNEKNCSVPEGKFYFDKLDLNKIEHLLWPSQREYGYFMWVFDVYSPSATIVCFEYVSWIRPPIKMVKKL